MEEVFQTLRCTPQGLTTEDAERRLQIFGHNKLEEKKVEFFFFSLCGFDCCQSFASCFYEEVRLLLLPYYSFFLVYFFRRASS